MEIFNFLTLILIAIVCADEGGRNHTTLNYDPAELLAKIFNTNMTSTAKRENNYQVDHIDNEPRQYGLLIEDTNRPIMFQDDQTTVQESDYNQQSNVGQKKKRRRRKKPKSQQFPAYPDTGNAEFSQSGFNRNPYANSGIQAPNGQFYKPPRPQQRPTIASGALSAISEALTSIALYDDYQCVPRLLCEAAGGGALGSSSLLQSVTGLQPLLTLLSAYNGISASPLFVFSRAIFLGMTSKGNTASCRYAYPQCPTDPEKLVHYLNNHNGGFFRFFNAPSGHQNVEQFYNKLSGQYGLYQPGIGNQLNIAQNQDQASHFSYGLQNPGLYNNQKYYGSGFNYNRYKNGVQNGFAERIQNKPSDFVNDDNFAEDDDDDVKSSWSFPNDNYVFTNNKFTVHNNYVNKVRGGKALKFPDQIDYNDIVTNSQSISENIVNNDPKDYVRRGKSILFPDTQYNAYVHNNIVYPSTTVVNHDDYVFDYKHNFYVKKDANEENDGVRTIYVVRGNGDPNNPEIVKIRPGQPHNKL